MIWMLTLRIRQRIEDPPGKVLQYILRDFVANHGVSDEANLLIGHTKTFLQELNAIPCIPHRYLGIQIPMSPEDRKAWIVLDDMLHR